MDADEQTIYDDSKKRRVRIFREVGGSYSFIEEVFSDEPSENCWLPLTSRRSKPICDSFETALGEAKGRVVWLANF
jgi:hypothetical protein